MKQQKIDSLKYNDIFKVRDSKWANEDKPYKDYPHRGLLYSSEAHFIYDAALRLGAGNYAHLGVFRGFSAWLSAHGLKQLKADGKIYCVDIWNRSAEPVERLLPPFAEQGLDHYLEICKGTTEEWGQRLKELKFKFVFVDASHELVDVLKDMELWCPLVEVGGEIAFHDCNLNTVTEALKSMPDNFKEIEGICKIRSYKRIK